MTTRDFAAEMRAVIDAETGDGPYVSAIAAEHIVAKLRATDPDLLDGWLQLGAVQFLHHAINRRDMAQRARARTAAPRSVFRAAAEAAEAGDTGPLTDFLSTVYVIEDGSRVRLAEMREPHLLFAAAEYGRRAAENALQEAFLRALARRVGADRVSDHFAEGRLAELWQSLSGR
jgi:hypothetical protein